MHDVPARHSGAITQAIRREREDLVSSRLAEMEPKEREVIVLRGIEQLPARTVAVMLSISPDAVAMRYHRALKVLRARLPGSVFDELDADGGAD